MVHFRGFGVSGWGQCFVLLGQGSGAMDGMVLV